MILEAVKLDCDSSTIRWKLTFLTCICTCHVLTLGKRFMGREGRKVGKFHLLSKKVDIL